MLSPELLQLAPILDQDEKVVVEKPEEVIDLTPNPYRRWSAIAIQHQYDQIYEEVWHKVNLVTTIAGGVIWPLALRVFYPRLVEEDFPRGLITQAAIGILGGVTIGSAIASYDTSIRVLESED